jgi:trehalose utilization protein
MTVNFSSGSSRLLVRFFFVLLVASVCARSAAAEPIRVLVWDEQQARQKPVYPDWLGGQIASHLRTNSKLEVTRAKLDDPEQGISTAAIESNDVLVWWGHVRQGEISEAKGKEIVARVRAGKLGLVILHSAHWSVPFMEAMQSRAADDALARLPEADRKRATVRFLGERKRKTPKRADRVFIDATYTRQADGSIEIALERPNCVFPSCCDPVEPAQVRTMLPKHPLAAGIPENFVIPRTEMYDEPFGVPAPDLVVFEESWEGGEHFRSGCVWNVGKGHVFYFRPGHETYPVFYEKYPLKIVENATVWLGETLAASAD